MLGLAVSLLAVMTLSVIVRSGGPPKKAMFSVRKSSFDRRLQRGHIIRLDEHLHTRPPSMVTRARRVKTENIRAPAEQPRSVRNLAEQRGNHLLIKTAGEITARNKARHKRILWPANRAEAIKTMSWKDMQCLFATIYVNEIAAVHRDGGEALVCEKFVNLSQDQRNVLRAALAEPALA